MGAQFPDLSSIRYQLSYEPGITHHERDDGFHRGSGDRPLLAGAILSRTAPPTPTSAANSWGNPPASTSGFRFPRGNAHHPRNCRPVAFRGENRAGGGLHGISARLLLGKWLPHP